MRVYEAIVERDNTVPARPDNAHIWYTGVGRNTRVWLIHTYVVSHAQYQLRSISLTPFPVCHIGGSERRSRLEYTTNE